MLDYFSVDLQIGWKICRYVKIVYVRKQTRSQRLICWCSWFLGLGIKKRPSTVRTEPVVNNPKHLVGKPLAVGDGIPLSGTPFEAY